MGVYAGWGFIVLMQYTIVILYGIAFNRARGSLYISF